MDGTVVETRSGRVQGEAGHGVAVFRGIPYAAPPVGRLRFQPPQPVQPWTAVRDATRFGPVAMQRPSPLERMLGSSTPEMSEDCLHLNVWTPAADDARRPVLVWIHGGAFVTGSGSTPWYDGRSFARNGDVVVVTINYRLGALGFLHLAGHDAEAFPASGNAGILDQAAALEWVRDNIEAFGGDPDNVTIFGESAGAMSVGTLLGLPAAKGLFHRAIAQSGAAHNALSSDDAARVAADLLAELGLDAPHQLVAVPVDALLEAQGRVSLKSWSRLGNMPFQPVVDGFSLPERPIDAVAAGSAAGVPVLTGTTAEEMRLFTVLDPRLGGIGRDAVVARCDSLFASCGGGASAFEAYQARVPTGSPLDIWSAIETDRVFRVPAVRLAEAQAGHRAPVYMYLFTWATPVFGGALGSCHALEIPFVFDNLDAPGAAMFTGPATDEMRRLARRMHDAWIAFARTGDPNHEDLPAWPAYEHDRRATMVFDESVTVDHDRDTTALSVWASVL